MGWKLDRIDLVVPQPKKDNDIRRSYLIFIFQCSKMMFLGRCNAFGDIGVWKPSSHQVLEMKF